MERRVPIRPGWHLEIPLELIEMVDVPGLDISKLKKHRKWLPVWVRSIKCLDQVEERWRATLVIKQRIEVAFSHSREFVLEVVKDPQTGKPVFMRVPSEGPV